ncbi:MAG: hypothetical protein CTY34_11880 [Methylobacter sp.]|nr:MAG: hypothetical protein CTY34_11880 [Methylobacter sp.]PPD03935.1 MAG: hypothetical protein CTY29_07735 [Methylobacter sp.]PPD22684.1 MAG: hypothetical protein CTY24_06320 [Methylobacter sp.]PPD33914.1 MAG: hypothetical protein CTY18_09170 [Methylomonas sp.]
MDYVKMLTAGLRGNITSLSKILQIKMIIFFGLNKWIARIEAVISGDLRAGFFSAGNNLNN